MEPLHRNDGIGSHWFQDICARLGRLATFSWTGGASRRGGGLTPGELRTLADKARNMSDLLPLRLAALRIDEAELARADPNLLREMQTACRLCDAKSHCTWDFVVDASNPRWEEYCANARALRAVQAVQSSEDKSG